MLSLWDLHVPTEEVANLPPWVLMQGGCCIQRHCLHEVMVLDTVGVMVLRVPRLKCRRHGREGPTSNETGCSFLITNPVVWQCLQARSPGLLFEPSIAVVSDGLIVAEEALWYA